MSISSDPSAAAAAIPAAAAAIPAAAAAIPAAAAAIPAAAAAIPASAAAIPAATAAIPASAAAMTAAWLTSALHTGGHLSADASVVGLVLEPIGEVVGVFGTVHRVRPTYAGPAAAVAAAPATLVAKFPTDVPENKSVGMALDLYAREIRALRHVASATPGLRYARVMHADMDIGSGSFALLIEEIAGKAVGDQVAGLTRGQVETVMEAIAALHAHWWDHPELGASDWLPRTDHPVQVAVVPDIIRSAMPVVDKRYGERLGEAAMAIGHRVAEQYEAIMAQMSARARTFAHTDLRAVNLFFGADGSDLTIIDWQLCTWSNPMQDVIYLLGSSVTADDFDAWGVDVMRQYHEHLSSALAERGAAYTWDELWHDAQLVSLWALVAPASTVGTFEMGNDLGARISDVWLDRAFRLPVVLGADALL